MDIDFFGNGLCIHCNLAKNELLEFANFNSSTEYMWKKRDETLQKDVAKILDGYDLKHHDEIVESYSWDLHLNQSKYPSIHRESIIITIYNFLENQLNTLCGILSKCIESNLKLKDLRGQGTERALNFLTKVVSFEFNDVGKERAYISNVNKLRNQIVHNGGLLPVNESDSLIKFISQNDHLSGQAGQGVNIHSEFITELIDILLSFFGKLDIEVQNFIQSKISSNDI